MKHLIAPSLLSGNFLDLRREVEMINNSDADWLHLDIMDGVFVPNITFGFPVLNALKTVCRKPMDVHLMIDRPVRYVERFCQAGADIVTVHVEADTEENTRKALERIRGCGKRAAHRERDPESGYEGGRDVESAYAGLFAGGYRA